jgi:release factor glutamine methyltransferase
MRCRPTSAAHASPNKQKRSDGLHVQARALVRLWVPRLEAAGVASPRLDAELLVAHAAGIDRDRLFLDDPALTEPQHVAAQALLARRAETRAPVAQLTGMRWFDGHPLHVSRDVLVPRPETEQLVERAAQLAPQGAAVLDVGTGSGAIAIALAARRPDLALTASDVSAPALAVAQANAAALLSAPIAFQHASLLGDWDGGVVVSNPPYVEDAWRQDAAPELDHEPDLALYAGVDGLDVIRPLVDACAARSGVRLVLLEHGHQQGAAIRALFRGVGFPDAVTEPDLAGYDRVTWARRAEVPGAR